MFGRYLAFFVSVAASAISLSSAQVVPDGSIDIGTVGLPGSSSGSGSDWTVTGSGSDVYGSYDHFHFMHFNRTADVTVTCLVKDFTQTSHNSWRKGGIMFRAGLGQRVPHSFLMQSGWGIAHQYRLCENCGSASYHDGYSTSNVWLRLVKEGNTVTSYVKRDGEYGFMKYFSHEVDLGAEFSIGLAVTSHDNSQIATLEVSDFEISDDVFSLPLNTLTEVGETGNGRMWVQEVAEGIWSLSAAGAGIGGTADAMGFLDTEQTGDITATLHLEKLVRLNGESKGGIMMRATNDVDSPHVSLLVKADDGITMFWRDAVGADTQSKRVGVWEEDMELRLVKAGDVVEASYKHAAAPEWYVLGTATVPLGASYNVGPAVSSAQHGQLTQLLVGELVVS